MPTAHSASEDSDIAFGKFLIARGIVSPEQVRENYQRLLDYRKTLGAQVNLAQVLARHDVASREKLRVAFQEFTAGSLAPPPPAPSREAKPFGFQTVELEPDERPDSAKYPAVRELEAPKPTFASGIPPTIDPEGPGPFSSAALAPRGLDSGPGIFSSASGIPPTIDPEGFAPLDPPAVSTGRAGPNGTHAQGRGPGGTQRFPGETKADSAAGSPFDESLVDGAGFPSAVPGSVRISGTGSHAVGRPVGTAVESGSLFNDSESNDVIPRGKLRADTNVQSSTFGGMSAKRRTRTGESVPRRGGVPLGAMLGIGVALVIVISIGLALFLRSQARAEAKRYFLAAVEEKPAEEALEIGEALDASLRDADPDVVDALERLRESVAAAKRRAEAAALLERVNEVSNLDERLAICTRAIEIDETYADAYVQRARVKYTLAKRRALKARKGGSKQITKDALADLLQAIQCSPDEAGPFYVRADILLDSGKDLDSRNLAMKDLQRARDMAPGTALAALAEGRRASLERKLPNAVELYDEAIEKDPRLLDAYLARAETRMMQADYAGALRDANQAVDSDASSARALTLRAQARFRANNDRTGALADLRQALEFDPTLAAAFALQAYVRLDRDSTGRVKSTPAALEQAEKDAERALLLDSTLPLAHMAMAEILWQRKEISSAITAAGKAIRHSFRFAEAHLLIARLRTQDNDHDQAFHDLDKVLQIEPENPRALTLKAQILVLRRDFDQAQRLLEQALELDRNLPQAFFSRALLSLKSRRPNRRKAIEDLSEAIGLKPNFAEAYFYRAAVYHDTGRFEDAINDLAKAEALRESVGGEFPICDVHLIRGHCHFLREDWEKAKVDYEAYLKLAPVGSNAIQNVRNRKKECEAKLAGD